LLLRFGIGKGGAKTAPAVCRARVGRGTVKAWLSGRKEEEAFKIHC